MSFSNSFNSFAGAMQALLETPCLVNVAKSSSAGGKHKEVEGKPLSKPTASKKTDEYVLANGGTGESIHVAMAGEDGIARFRWGVKDALGRKVYPLCIKREAAQRTIDTLFGNGKYTVSKI